MKLSSKQKVLIAVAVLVLAVPVATNVTTQRKVSRMQKEVKQSGSKVVFHPIAQTGSRIIIPFMGHYKNGTYRRGYGWHTGLDYIMRRADRGLGEPLYAIADGVVLNSTPTLSPRGYGHLLLIDHPQLGVQSRYGHLQTRKVKTGDRVKAGQLVGTMGTSGTDNVHLHFDIIKKPLPSARWNIKGDTEQDKATNLQYFTDPVVFFQQHQAKDPGAQ